MEGLDGTRHGTIHAKHLFVLPIRALQPDRMHGRPSQMRRLPRCNVTNPIIFALHESLLHIVSYQGRLWERIILVDICWKLRHRDHWLSQHRRCMQYIQYTKSKVQWGIPGCLPAFLWTAHTCWLDVMSVHSSLARSLIWCAVRTIMIYNTLDSLKMLFKEDWLEGGDLHTWVWALTTRRRRVVTRRSAGIVSVIFSPMAWIFEDHVLLALRT